MLKDPFVNIEFKRICVVMSIRVFYRVVQKRVRPSLESILPILIS